MDSVNNIKNIVFPLSIEKAAPSLYIGSLYKNPGIYANLKLSAIKNIFVTWSRTITTSIITKETVRVIGISLYFGTMPTLYNIL